MKKLVVFFCIFVAAIYLISNLGGNRSLPPATATSVSLAAPEVSAAKPAIACAVGASVGDAAPVAVLGEYEIRQSPDQNGARIKNEKASAILGGEHYHVVDTSTTVRALCSSGDWREVQIVTPDWLNSVRGWVPANVLRPIERTSDGARIYTASDFNWDGTTSAYQSHLVTIINKIAREHDGCRSIDTASLALSASRSRPDAPVFFVTCEAVTPFNVWFEPGDVNHTFGAVVAISQSDAVSRCEAEAKARATHPSTVSFSRVLDVDYGTRPDGRAVLTSRFTARNSFNLELTYQIRCVFDGVALIEASVDEVR